MKVITFTVFSLKLGMMIGEDYNIFYLSIYSYHGSISKLLDSRLALLCTFSTLFYLIPLLTIVINHPREYSKEQIFHENILFKNVANIDLKGYLSEKY